MAELTTSTLLTKSPTMTLGKPAAPTATALAAQSNFVTKAKPVKASRQPKLLSDPSADYMKIMMYGGTATGKSLTLAGLLRAGHTVLAVSTDIGGEGFASVRQELRNSGEGHLLDNASFFEIQNYDDMEDFCCNPTEFFPGIYDLDIDTLFFDGGSSFQICHIQDKILSMEAVGSADKQSDARNAGLGTTMTDWGSVRIATIKNLNKFLLMRNEKTGKNWHKVITFLESEKAKDNNNEVKIGALMQGAAAKLLEPCFDLIFRAVKKRVTEGDKKVLTYQYQMEGASDRIITKSRGFKFNPTEPGDFLKLWKEVCLQRGIPAGKK
jgi:hypothetical protein